MNAKEKLLAKFRKKSPLTKAALTTGKAAQAALKELIGEGEILKIGTRFFLESTAPTAEREKARIDARLRGSVKLFKENALHFGPRVKLPTTRAALDELVDARVILRLEIEKDRKAGALYLHSAHAHAHAAAGAAASSMRAPESSESPPRPSFSFSSSSSTRSITHQAESAKPTVIPEPEPPPADPTAPIRKAYAALVARNGSDSVFISALASESGISVSQLQRWIQENVIEKGQGTLNEGDWSYATEEQRAAAMLHRDRRRLYLRLHS